MSDHSAVVAALLSERDTFRELCQVLEAEQACLVRSDVDGLQPLAEMKSDKVDRLVDLARARVADLDASGFSTGRRGMTEWLATQTGSQRPELSQLWDELVEFASNARSLNDINGKLITTRLTHNQAALAALQSAARAQNVYGPDGQATIVAGHRELGRA